MSVRVGPESAECSVRRASGVRVSIALSLLAACSPPVVDFTREGVAPARAAACAASYDDGARVGAAAEVGNAPSLWADSPYLVLLPASGVGYVSMTIDATGYDWLLYTDEGVLLESLAEPEALANGVVETCADPRLAEYGAHHHETSYWPLRLSGAPGVRVRLYATLSATPHAMDGGHAHGESDAGHADH